MNKFYKNIIASLILVSIVSFSFVAQAMFNFEPIAKIEDGYARITFEWYDNIGYKASVKGDELNIYFDKPIIADFKKVLNKTPGYLKSFVQSEDRKNITFKMYRDFILRDYLDGKKVVVDLLGKPANVVQPPEYKLPSDSPRPKKKPVIRDDCLNIRVGRHDGFYRFVFDWGIATNYNIVERDGNIVAVSFSNYKKIDLKSLKHKLPKEMKDVSFDKNNNGMIVYIPGVLVKDFVVKSNNIVVDVKIAPKEADKVIILKEEKPVVEKIEVSDATDMEEVEPAPVKEVEKENIQEIDTVDVVEDLSNVNIIKEANNDNVDDKESDVIYHSINDNTEFLKRNDELLDSRVATLSVSWNNPVNLAVFYRHGYNWIVFDEKQDINLDDIKKKNGDFIKEIVQLNHTKATIVRVLVDKDISPSVRREGLLWIVDFLRQPMKPNNDIKIQPRFSAAQNPQLFFNVEQSSSMISIADPGIGDTINVIPSFSLGAGVATPRSYPEFDVYPSVQGIAIGPKSDSLKIDVSNRGVEIYYPEKGLSLTKDADAINELRKLQKSDSILEPFDVAGWGRGGRNYIIRDTAKLLEILCKANKNNINLARLELARYYVANGYGAEALGILRTIKETKNNLDDKAAFYAARGIANFLMQRYDEAVEDFSNELLKDNIEASLWKTVCLSATDNSPKKYYEEISQKAGILKTYTRELRVPLALVGARASVDAGDDLATQNLLELAHDKQAPVNKQAEYYYYKAEWAINTGNFLSAVNEYKNAENTGSRKFAAIAKRDRLILQYKLGKMKLEDIIEEFERLRYSWRGDNFEYTVLVNLAIFYSEQNEYPKTLRLLNEIDKIYKDGSESKIAREKMQKIFNDLYLKGKADDMSPIKAIALFEEFRHLVPEGEDGHKMIRKLSDRLVAVDLLYRAETLIENQINKPDLSIEEKSRMGAKLALIYLLDKKPGEALLSLKNSDNDNITEDLKFQRKRLKARALAYIGKVDDAIELIGNDKNKKTMLLKTEIYWKAKKWDEAADTIRELIERPKINQPLSDEQAQLIVDWATALKLAGRDSVIVRLRKNFLPYLKGTKYYDAFTMLTMDLEDGQINTKSIDSLVQQAEGFKNFIGDFNL